MKKVTAAAELDGQQSAEEARWQTASSTTSELESVCQSGSQPTRQLDSPTAKLLVI